MGRRALRRPAAARPRSGDALPRGQPRARRDRRDRRAGPRARVRAVPARTAARRAPLRLRPGASHPPDPRAPARYDAGDHRRLPSRPAAFVLARAPAR